MTVTTARKFRIGDRVQVTHALGGTIWTVVGDDTGKTPVHDPEPAYKLLSQQRGKKKGHQIYRYAYESDLVAAYWHEFTPSRAGASA